MVPQQNEVYYKDDLCEQNGVEALADTWWMQAIEATGGELLANGSYSGSLVSGDGFPAGRSMERARQILGAQGEQPDRVLIYFGINDYGEGTAVPAFEQAYDEMLANLAAVAPHAELLCITLLPGRSQEHDVDFFRAKYKGENLDDYNAAIRRAVAQQGARLVDIAAQGEPFDTLDGTHPTNRGMRQLSQVVIEHIRKL